MADNALEQLDGETAAIIEERVVEPPKYRVLLHNDDCTTMDFVVGILCRIFHKTIDEATQIMLKVHNTGIGQCGIYTREIAEAKVARVRHDAAAAGFPLVCTMEKD